MLALGGCCRYPFLRVFILGLCGVAFAACEISRPAGSYTPEERAPTIAEITREKPMPDAGTEDTDSEVVPDMEPTEDPSVTTDPADPLSKLVGNYLMRVDVYSEADVSQSGTAVSTSNRVSNLLLAKVRLQDGRLISSETLCHQSYSTTCLKNTCSEWKTEVVSAIAKRYFPQLKVERAYDVNDTGKLVAERSVLALGFDEDAAVDALPINTLDPRVWVTTPNNTAIYGLGTVINAKVGFVLLECLVNAVQRFATAFGGQLDMSLSDPLTQKAMLVDTGGTAGATVDAKGSPNPPCNKSSIDAAGAKANESTTVVRFRRTDLANCPASISDFESKFPGTSNAPAAADLM